MSPCVPKPLIGVVASLLPVADGRYVAHGAGETNIDALEQFAGCVPVILPALGERLDVHDMLSRIDGLMLTGGRANVEPHYYGGAPFPADEVIDPGRDATAIPMVLACIREQVPIFGVCRGIQEINVALGGSLHYRIHEQPEFDDHRMPRHDDVTLEEIFELRHPVKLNCGGTFASLAGCEEILVNSLHGQGIDRLASNLVVEAVSPDGVIEGVRLKDDVTFTVGVQWHAEWRPHAHGLSRALFREFGNAARLRAQRRTGVSLAG